MYITKLEKEKADSVADIKRLQQILDEQDEAEKKGGKNVLLYCKPFSSFVIIFHSFEAGPSKTQHIDCCFKVGPALQIVDEH